MRLSVLYCIITSLKEAVYLIQVEHFSKKYGDSIVVNDISFVAKDGSIAMIALMVGMIVIPLNRTFELPAFSTIIAVVSAVAAVILIVAAFTVNRAAVKKAERLLSAVD